MIPFIVAHQAVCAGLLVAALDFAFALAPGLEANGIVHAAYLFLVGKKAA